MWHQFTSAAGVTCGWMGQAYNSDNETEHVSTIRDPGKYRFAVNQGVVEHNLGGPSFNTRRDSGVHDEHALIQGQIFPDNGDIGRGFGAIEFCTRGPGREQVDQRLHLRHDQALFHVPVNHPEQHMLKAPGGIFWLTIQSSDGNFVAYKNRVPYDYSTGEPYWSSGVAPQ